MAETSRDRIEQRRIAVSVIVTAMNRVRDGLAMEYPVEPASREDWLRILDRARRRSNLSVTRVRTCSALTVGGADGYDLVER